MALFKYLKRETTSLLDKWTWDATAKFKFCRYFFLRLVWGQIAKFKDHQYFQLYGTLQCRFYHTILMHEWKKRYVSTLQLSRGMKSNGLLLLPLLAATRKDGGHMVWGISALQSIPLNSHFPDGVEQELCFLWDPHAPRVDLPPLGLNILLHPLPHSLQINLGEGRSGAQLWCPREQLQVRDVFQVNHMYIGS